MTRIPCLSLLLISLTGCSTAIAQGVTPFGNVLIWHPSEETSSIWSSAVTTSDSLNTFSAANVQFDWNAGLRIGLAHRRDEQSWDAKLYWTSFRSSGNASYPSGGQAIIPEFFSGFVSGDALIFDGAKVDWGLTFNTVDFELGRTVGIGQSMSVRPSLGVKAAVIDQRIQANWTSFSLDLDAIERIDHDFQGIGPSFGIDGRWVFPRYRNLSLVGSFSGAFLWGTWNVEDTYERTDTAYPLLAYGAFTTSMKDSSLGTLNLNYFMGLEWVRPGKVTITGRLGYELQWWANQQRLTTFQQLPMHGDLTLQGLTCGISLGF